VGATVAYAAARSEPELRRFAFLYDVQMHNGRDAPLAVLGREWGFLDARGVLHPESGPGLGGLRQLGKVRLLPGQALQYQGAFTLPTPTGVAAGRFVVVLDEDEPDRAQYDVVVAPMGVSVDGRPVPPIEQQCCTCVFLVLRQTDRPVTHT